MELSSKVELTPRVLSFSSTAASALSACSSPFEVLFVQKKSAWKSPSAFFKLLTATASAMLLAAPGDLSSQTVWRTLSYNDHFLCYFSLEDLVPQMRAQGSHCSPYRKCSYPAYLDGVLEDAAQVSPQLWSLCQHSFFIKRCSLCVPFEPSTAFQWSWTTLSFPT